MMLVRVVAAQGQTAVNSCDKYLKGIQLVQTKVIIVHREWVSVQCTSLGLTFHPRLINSNRTLGNQVQSEILSLLVDFSQN